MEQVKIVLVDDHQIVRDGIKSLLKDQEHINIIAEAHCGSEIMELLSKIAPDLIIMDISMPGKSGIEIAQEIKEKYTESKILFLSMFLNEEFILNGIKAGAKGYLPKNTTKTELLKAIETINAGNDYFSEEVSKIILKSYVKSAQNEEEDKNKIELLTNREIEILKLFADGYTNHEISDMLHISIRTVESHKTHIMQKLEMKSTVELIKFALKNNIIKL